jgi:MFS family permease
MLTLSFKMELTFQIERAGAWIVGQADFTDGQERVTALSETQANATSKAPRLGLWLGFVGLAALAVSMAQTILIPVLGQLPHTLHTSADNVQWLLTSTLLVAAVAVPVMGRLGDMFGKRRLLLVAVAMLVVGSLVTALTSNLALLIAGRAVQGLSAAAIPLGISLLSSLVPREKAGSAIATVSAMLGVGGALGLPLAGFIAEHFDYHALFWVTAAAGAVALLGLLLFVPEAPSSTGGRIDYAGALLLGAALIALLLPLSETSVWGWGSAAVIGLLVASVVLLVVFGLVERRIAAPLVDLATLRRRPILLTNLASLLFGFALFASLIATASYVEAPKQTGYGFGESILVGGLAMLPSGLAMLVLAPVSARLAARIGGPRTLATGAVIVAAGWLLRMVATGSLWEILVGVTIVGAGTGIGYAAMPAIVNSHTPATELASANGLNTLVRSAGSSLASAIGGSIFAASTVAVGAFMLPSLHAYRLLFLLCAAAALAAAVIAFAIPRAPGD